MQKLIKFIQNRILWFFKQTNISNILLIILRVIYILIGIFKISIIGTFSSLYRHSIFFKIEYVLLRIFKLFVFYIKTLINSLYRKFKAFNIIIQLIIIVSLFALLTFMTIKSQQNIIAAGMYIFSFIPPLVILFLIVSYPLVLIAIDFKTYKNILTTKDKDEKNQIHFTKTLESMLKKCERNMKLVGYLSFIILVLHNLILEGSFYPFDILYINYPYREYNFAIGFIIFCSFSFWGLVSYMISIFPDLKKIWLNNTIRILRLKIFFNFMGFIILFIFLFI